MKPKVCSRRRVAQRGGGGWAFSSATVPRVETRQNPRDTIPIKHFDAVSNTPLSKVVESFKYTSFQSRNLAKCLDVLIEVLTDPARPVVFMGLSGAMVPAGMRKVVRDMIRLSVVDVLVSTGANLFHDLHEALGFHHYVGSAQVDDVMLEKMDVDRIYDTYAWDEEFVQTDKWLVEFADKLEPRLYSSREFLHILGEQLSDDESILKTAAEMHAPIFCPALSDSSIGIALTAYRLKRLKAGKRALVIDPILDNLEMLEIKQRAVKTAALYVGGGVPKNYIQQVTPMAEIVGRKLEGHAYAVQITTDDPKWGGLSGCTLEESQSWGKLTSEARHATVYVDATIGLPLLFKALVERRDEWQARQPLALSSPVK
ncbi:MAG: deoxyhypusine synthase family protein [Candidatus Bathyarchaeia archaeon]